MYRKVQLFLHRREHVALGMLEGHLASEGQRVREHVPEGGRHRRLLRVQDDPTRQIAHGEEMTAGTDAAYDAVFEVGGGDIDFGELVSAVKDVGIRLGDWVDLSRSTAMAGEEYTVIPGSEPMELLFALHRLPSLGAVEFHQHWRNEHAELARKITVLQGYRQFHADADASGAACESAGLMDERFDGAAEGFYRSRDAFMRIMSDPAVTVDALEDERTFIDHGRSVIGLYHVAWDSPG